MSKYSNLYTELESRFTIVQKLVRNIDLQFSPEAASITLAVFCAPQNSASPALRLTLGQ